MSEDAARTMGEDKGGTVGMFVSTSVGLFVGCLAKYTRVRSAERTDR